MKNKQKWLKNAVLTNFGWVNKDTGEVLISIPGNKIYDIKIDKTGVPIKTKTEKKPVQKKKSVKKKEDK